MKWMGRRESGNVEDRRGRTSRRAVGGGLGTLVIILIVYLLGGDPQQLLQNLPVGETAQVADSQFSEAENQLAKFTAVVLGDTEDVWHRLFAQMGRSYEEPKLVLFSDAVQSACGYSGAATGPFYCPGDNKVYIDLAFFQELQSRFEAPGDFAAAYVIAHEVGHHVQNLLGITNQVMALRNQVSQREFNRYLVRLELQADFLAGVWAHHAQRMKNILEPGDIEEALNAAAAVGDDRIQRQTSGRVVPDAFTHGTSAQRVAWFTKGFNTGDLNQGDTFSVPNL